MRPESSLKRWETAVCIALVAAPLLLAAWKLMHGSPWPALPSLMSLPKHARRHLDYLMFVPLSLTIVAFFRLTLGIRVLSIFRPALIAIAFERTGVPLGLGFLAAALGVVVALQAPLKGRHYYERVPVVAVTIVGMMVLCLMGFTQWRSTWMLHLAYFPVIALCLTCESFASALAKSGAAEAVWLAFTTTLVGVAVMEISTIPGFTLLFIRCPELLIAEAGCVLLIGRHLRFNLFESFNPLRAVFMPTRRIEVQQLTEIAVEMNQ